jgi:hypothetical protein
MTASPLPYIRPSNRLAAMPLASSVGWFGCSRVDRRAGQADRVAKARDDAALARHQHQVLDAHDLRHGGRHLRRDARRDARQLRLVGLVAQQPVAQAADGEVARSARRRGVVASMIRRVTSSVS